jgi:hypothetical protein
MNVEIQDVLNKDWMDLSNMQLLDFLFIVNKLNENLEFMDFEDDFIVNGDYDLIANKLWKLEIDIRHKILSLMS